MINIFKRFIIVYSIVYLIKPVISIDCFVCMSKNNENPDCEDPFFRSQSVSLEHNCLTGIPDHNGTYRATHCLKLTASGHGMSLVIRTCSISTGTNINEREIVRVSHCGYLMLQNFHGINETLGHDFNKYLFRGCISVCGHDACNFAIKKHISTFKLLYILFILFYLFIFNV